MGNGDVIGKQQNLLRYIVRIDANGSCTEFSIQDRKRLFIIFYAQRTERENTVRSAPLSPSDADFPYKNNYLLPSKNICYNEKYCKNSQNRFLKKTKIIQFSSKDFFKPGFSIKSIKCFNYKYGVKFIIQM